MKPSRLLTYIGLAVALFGCDGSPISTVPSGELPIYDIKRNPVIWTSDKIYASYNSTDSIATIRLPRLLLDTSDADDIVISYEMYEWPDCDVVSATTGSRHRVQCPSIADLWWGGRFDIALSGFEQGPGTAFVDGTRRIRLWARDNPRAWAQMIKYRTGYEPLHLNKVGREIDWYTREGRIQMSSDNDGVWLRWWADLDFSVCPGYGPNILADTLVKLDASGERVDEVVLRDIPIRDFSVNASRVWVLTTETGQRILQLVDGVVVGEYNLGRLGYYEYSSLIFVQDTLWTAETHLAENVSQLKLRQLDFTVSSPTDSPTQLDSLIFPSYIAMGPTWDGEAFVYWTDGIHGQELTRRDRSGHIIESVRSTLILSGDVCRAVGSYWVTHHCAYGAAARGVFLSRVSF